ncbi:hypothetical protein DEJ30_12045 [Curtobacterium sp. MCPF17_003]|uniref:hypothetical protein n=1 Tax=Curtobacterium sp. MCPF17_003 TaxID=2175637 RepID=UPI000D85B4D4|nr:hypothetical protein [Curtobacterium sp. MCPF17_003]PYY63638.1 hypothetical protein DEJ30_12045 [Curtobacterium sp. MCPF17_003]
MPATTRVPGHELRSEGAAYRKGDRRGQHLRVTPGWTTSGTGYALCSCGATSAVLTSGTKRKAWHRDHKNEVTAAPQQ